MVCNVGGLYTSTQTLLSVIVLRNSHKSRNMSAKSYAFLLHFLTAGSQSRSITNWEIGYISTWRKDRKDMECVESNFFFLKIYYTKLKKNKTTMTTKKKERISSYHDECCRQRWAFWLSFGRNLLAVVSNYWDDDIFWGNSWKQTRIFETKDVSWFLLLHKFSVF